MASAKNFRSRDVKAKGEVWKFGKSHTTWKSLYEKTEEMPKMGKMDFKDSSEWL